MIPRLCWWRLRGCRRKGVWFTDRTGCDSCASTTWTLVFLLALFVLISNLGSLSDYRVMQNQMTLQMSDIEEKASYRAVIEEADGSLSVVFHIPAASKHLIRIMRSKRSSASNGTVGPLRGSKPPAWRKAISGLFAAKPSSGHEAIESYSRSPVANLPLSTQADPYTLNSPDLCKGVNVTFLVAVHSATEHFERRNSIRETWANSKLFRKHSMRTVFLLGKPKSESTQILLEHERRLHGDLVQGNFLDSYHNLTHKGVLGLRWISDFCRNSQIVLKVDDDVFINPFQILDDFLSNHANSKRQISCAVRKNGTSPIMRQKSKWKVEDTDFKNMTHYPVSYCNGFFVMVTSDIIPEMYRAATTTPFFWVDDVYLFGLLPDKIGHVTYTQLSNLNLNEKKAKECFTNTEPCKLVVATARSPGVMEELWFGLLTQHRGIAKQYARPELFKI